MALSSLILVVPTSLLLIATLNLKCEENSND